MKPEHIKPPIGIGVSWPGTSICFYIRATIVMIHAYDTRFSSVASYGGHRLSGSAIAGYSHAYSQFVNRALAGSTCLIRLKDSLRTQVGWDPLASEAR